MFGIEEILKVLVGQVPALGLVLMGLGALVVVGQVVVLITPSKSDDEFLKKLQDHPIIGGILKAILSFAPIQKK